MTEEEKKEESLLPILVTKNELRLIIHWKKNCDDSSCPLYSVEKGDYCEAVITKLVKAFRDWPEEEKELEGA